MLCGTDNILQKIPHIQTKHEEYFCIILRKILSAPLNTLMDLNNVMLNMN